MGQSIGNLYATVTLKNEVDGGAAKVAASFKRMQREIEASAGKSLADVRGGILSGEKGGSRSSQMREIYAGLELSAKAMDAEAVMAKRMAGQGLAKHDPAYNGMFGATQARAGAGASESSGPSFRLAGMAKGLGVAAAGIEAVSIATKAWKGDWEGVRQQVESLPFGIGHVASAVTDLIGEWSGANEEIRRYKELSGNIDRDTAARRKAAETIRAVTESTTLRNNATKREIGGIGMDPGIGATLYGIDAATKNRVDQIAHERDKTLKDSGLDKASKEYAAMAKQFQSQIALEEEKGIKRANEAKLQATESYNRRREELEQESLENIQRDEDEAAEEYVRKEKLKISRKELALQQGAQKEAAAAKLNGDDVRADIIGIKSASEARARAMEREGDYAAAQRERELGDQQALMAAYNNAKSIVNGQNLGIMGAGANPTVAISGKAQREEALKNTLPDLQKIANDLLRQVVDLLKNDGGVPVGA